MDEAPKNSCWGAGKDDGESKGNEREVDGQKRKKERK